MTTDRELLEYAAKAAKMDIEWQPCGWAHDNETGCEWKPLTDDGDAFRLAVKLALDIHIVGMLKKDDLLAATRRAIVRAAAEIGRNMV